MKHIKLGFGKVGVSVTRVPKHGVVLYEEADARPISSTYGDTESKPEVLLSFENEASLDVLLLALNRVKAQFIS